MNLINGHSKQHPVRRMDCTEKNLALDSDLSNMEQADPNFVPDAVELFDMFSDMVYRVAFVRTSQPSDADDIFQEVFLRLVKYKDTLKNLEHAKAWLIRCTINCCNSHHRSAWQSKTTELEEYFGQSDLSYESVALLDAVRSLSPEHREVIHLFYYEDYANKEIAEILGINENTVKSRLRRARLELKSVWNEEGDVVETE